MNKIAHSIVAVGVGLGMVCAEAASVYDTLTAGDVISVQVYKHPAENLTLKIAEDGNVRLPFAGTVHLAGRGCFDVEKLLVPNFKLRGVKNPVLFVTIVSSAPRVVYVMGAIAGSQKESARVPQGKVSIPYGQELTAMQAISSVGGFAPDANVSKVIIRRTKGDRVELIPVPADRILSGALIKDIELLPQDMIVVPTK